MSGSSGNTKELEFRYESSSTSSFLVIDCRARILEFQARMLENNDIRYVVPVEAVKSEGTCHLYYNITSRIPLLMYLKRYKLNRVEFLRLFLSLSSSIINSAGYLLSSSNFLFDPEYVYIEPDTMEARLIYIPAESEDHCGGTLQTLVSDVLMQHINEAGFGGNLVQRILSEIKSETFSLKSFMILVNELLYGDEAGGVPARPPEQDSCEKILENSCKKDKIEEKQEYKENKENKENINADVFPRLVVPAVLLQLIMGGIVFMCRGFLDNVGENRTATYAAVLMIIVAVDVLIFKRLQALKLLKTSSDSGSQQSVPEDKPEQMVTDRQLSRNETSASKAYQRLKKLTDSALPEKNKEFDRNIQYVNSTFDTNAVLSNEPVCRHEGITTAIDRDLPRGADAGTDAGNIDHMDGEVPDDIALRYIQKTEILGNNTKKVHMLKSRGRFANDRDIVIDRDEIIIGRLQGHVDHVLLNNAVGKLHAELICRNGSCFVKDLNSINGTFVNEVRIESNKEVELKNNDSLQFANSEFVYLCS